MLDPLPHSTLTMGHSKTDTTSTGSPPHYFEGDHQKDASGKFDFDLESVIPEEHEHRTLVLCFDGTGDQFDDDNSNVVNFFSLLKKDDPELQLVYYQAGIGTYTIPQIARPIAAKLKRLLDMMVGVHLDAHVMGGYEFLMQNYKSGDKICIFGFSRGAYTARALAGMIHKIGLLPRCNHQQVPFAYKMYSRQDVNGWRQSGNFKQAFSIDVDIDFLGVWDTVGSVGVIPKGLPFTTTNTHIKVFRHAVSLDERRARFKPNLMHHPTKEQKRLELPPGCMPKSKRPQRRPRKPVKNQEGEGGCSECPTDAEEVWFAGCHSDVGGGSVPNDTRNSLARIPLRWMIRQCFLCETGIMFHREMLKTVGMDPSTLNGPRPPAIDKSQTTAIYERKAAAIQKRKDEMQKRKAFAAIHKGETIPMTLESRMTFFTEDFVNEEEEDVKDALAKINDMLEEKWGWWILEVIPQTLKYQTDDDDHLWKKEILLANWGKARRIPHKHGVKVHRTVRIRMEAEAKALEAKKGYAPKPKWAKSDLIQWDKLDSIQWVD